MRKVTFNLSDHIAKQAEQLAWQMTIEQQHNVSLSEVLRLAVTAYVLKELRKREKGVSDEAR